jgi:hypothetical protein
VRAVVEATFADHLLHVAVLVEEQAILVDVAGEEGGTHQRHSHHLGGGEPDLRVIPVADGLRELFAQAVDGDDSTVHLVLSIQREGFRRPSDREDIDYPDRGPLGLQYQAIGFIALRSHKRVSWRREMLVWIGMHSRSCSMATTMYC